MSASSSIREQRPADGIGIDAAASSSASAFSAGGEDRLILGITARRAYFDAAAWVGSIVVAILLRFDFRWHPIEASAVILLCLLAAVCQIGLGVTYSLYRGRYRYGSFDELRGLLATLGSVAAVVFAALWFPWLAAGLPRSVAFIAFPFALGTMLLIRFISRVKNERAKELPPTANRTLIYGAGSMGEHVLRLMLEDKSSLYRPVGLIDDDPRRRNLRLQGVPVLGPGQDLGRIAEEVSAETLIVSIARVEADLLRDIADRADGAGLRLLVLPELHEILEGRNALNDLRDVAIEDIIGRRPVDTAIDQIAGYVTDKRVLVTGAGGSIGSELCRQISKFGPRELIMLDRDESGLHGVQISIVGHGLLNTDDVVLADIRDAYAIMEIFCERHPDVVFHAAALKHLPMLEQYPEEAWKTNVLGTLNVLRAAEQAGVRTFVNISTDKAANPTSVLGVSKRTAERLTAWFAENADMRCLSVRFGNVLGSRGSVLPTFLAQIESGGPVTVTHPEVTRYFMTIPEACQLVVQAGAIGRPGEVLILDMGQPVKILDIARRMIKKSRQKIEVVFTGLREGEKLHEDLIAKDESAVRPFHAEISHTAIASLNPDEFHHGAWVADVAALRRLDESSQGAGLSTEVGAVNAS